MKNTSLFIVTLLITTQVMAQIPSTINFQGTLADPLTGDVVADGDYEITFAIFDAAIDGTNGWSETQTVVVMNGIFNVKLGAVNPLPPELFSQPLWLDINISGESLTPRVELSSTPYSQAAKSLIGDNFIPNSGNVHIGGSLDVGGVAPAIDLAIDDDDTGLDVTADGILSLYTNGIEAAKLSSDTLSFYTAGLKRFNIDASGKLSTGIPTGVGSNSKLEINYDDLGAGANFGGMWISSSNTTGQPYYGYQNGNAQAYTYLDGNDADKWKLVNGGTHLTIMRSGNVGIGNVNPPEKLSVSGNIAATDTVKADVFAYNNPRIQYLFLSGFDFKIAVESAAGVYLDGYDRRYLRGATLGAAYFIIAPFHLPDNATITAVHYYLSDSDATYNIEQLRIYSNGTTGGYPVNTLIGAGATTGSSGSQTVFSTGLSIEVDNTNQGFWLYGLLRQAASASTLAIHGARITYTVANE